MITITNAAKLRGVSQQAMFDLVKRGKLEAIEIDGVKFLRRDEVENYQPAKGGRPRRPDDAANNETSKDES